MLQKTKLRKIHKSYSAVKLMHSLLLPLSRSVLLPLSPDSTPDNFSAALTRMNERRTKQKCVPSPCVNAAVRCEMFLCFVGVTVYVCVTRCSCMKCDCVRACVCEPYDRWRYPCEDPGRKREARD